MIPIITYYLKVIFLHC